MSKIVAYVAVPVIIDCANDKIEETVKEMYGAKSYVGYDYTNDGEASFVDMVLALKNQYEMIEKIKTK
jgi:hypothetical protein